MTAPASAPEYGEFVYVRHIVGNPYGNVGSTTGVEYTVDIENLISGGYMAIAPGSVPEPYTPPLGSRGVDPLNPALGQWAYVQNNVGTPYGVAGTTVGVEVTTHVKRLVQDGALSFTLPPTSQYDEFPLYSDNTFASLGMVKDLMLAYYGGYDGSEGDYSHLIISQRLRDAIAEEMSITYDPTVQALIDEARDFNADTKIARDEAKVSETNAKTSETNAKSSETKSKTSETNAKTSEDNARGHADTATTKANQAGTSATTATTKAGEAATSATNAKTSETNAKTSENNAASSSGTASTSASTASTKASEASASALAASGSETRAKTSETNAKTSETNAKTSETNAKSSETKSKTSETNAKTSETNALASKNAAATSATNAKTSETNAKTSETNAATSATKAQQHAEEFDLDFTSTTLPPEAAATVVVTGDGPAYSVEIGVPEGKQGQRGPTGEVSQATFDAGMAGKADLVGGKVPLGQLPELGSTDAADLTGALTNQVDASAATVPDPNTEFATQYPLGTFVQDMASSVIGFYHALAVKADLDHQHPVSDLTASGTASSSTFLRGDGSWATPPDATDVSLLTGALTDQVDLTSGLIDISQFGLGPDAPTHMPLGAWFMFFGSMMGESFADRHHLHPVGDIEATGAPSSSTFLRGDGTWETPPNTTYAVPSQAEAESGTGTTGRAFSAQRVRQAANAAITAREWTGTQAQYDALATKDPNTTYYVVEG